ncbi:MAG: thiopeptide-type bacteriocin biosynthesis protein [Pseudonocardiaceae bacterium]
MRNRRGPACGRGRVRRRLGGEHRPVDHDGRGGTPHPQAVVAASFTDLASAFTGSVRDGLRWLLDYLKQHPAPALARDVYDQAMRLADPRDDWAALRALPGGELLALAWASRRSALAAYRTHLTDAQGPEPDRVLTALLHLHHTRVVGIDPDSERVCFRLARAAALGWAARNEGSTPSPSTSPTPTRQPQP